MGYWHTAQGSGSTWDIHNPRCLVPAQLLQGPGRTQVLPWARKVWTEPPAPGCSLARLWVLRAFGE